MPYDLTKIPSLVFKVLFILPSGHCVMVLDCVFRNTYIALCMGLKVISKEFSFMS